MRTHFTACRGVNLIELMIALAIIAIFALFGLPAFRDLIIQNRIIAQINTLSALVQFARSHAIDHQSRTLMCPTPNFTDCSTDWQQPLMVFSDDNNNNKRDEDKEILLVAKGAISKQHILYGPKRIIGFYALGSVSSPATLLICHNNKESRFARALTLSLQGRVKMSRDTNNDGIYETNSGKALECK